MKNKERVGTLVGTSILIIIAITFSVFVWAYEKGQDWDIAEIQTKTIPKKIAADEQAKKSPDSEMVEIESAGKWKRYQDKNLGLTFNYPADWGDIIIENGKSDRISTPPCKSPMMMLYSSKSYPWGIYDAALKFSQAPIDLEIRLLNLNTPGIPKKVCNIEGEPVAISTIQPKIQNREISITNKSGITFVSDPFLLTSINSDLAGPTYMSRHNDKLIWIYSGFTPKADTSEEAELRKYECAGADYYNTEKGCGIIAWAQTGITSEKIRGSFDDLRELVQSFSFEQ